MIAPWQALVLYALGGALTIFLAELWQPSTEKEREEGVPFAIVFVLWPLFVGAGALWCVFNAPAGIAWCGRWVRERCDR